MLPPFLIAVLITAAASPAPPRRFAVVVGNNTGDVGDGPLRFAETDAQHMLAVLEEVGGVEPDDATALYGLDATHLRAALDGLEQRLAREARADDQLVVYISSHADDESLHLGGEHFPLHELTQRVRQAPVAVALLIVDSCQSGAVTRVKGLRPVSGVSVAIEAGDVRGRVVMGSSRVDEYAQESDAIQGSYFTHHLTQALRGAADLSHDGKVTLQEAYTYAYEHTVESTFASQGGVQHPSFHVDLSGQGDLVLTDLGRGPGRLAIKVDSPGQYLITEPATGALVGQFWKGEGVSRFALSPGTYQVQVVGRTGGRTAQVTVPASGEASLQDGDLTAIARSNDLRKGGVSEATVSVEAQASTSVIGLQSLILGAGSGLALPWRPGLAIDEVNLHLSVGTGQISGGAGAHETEIELRSGPSHRWGWGSIGLAAGLECGGVLVIQERVPSDGSRVGVEPLAEVVARGSWRVAEHAALTGSMGAGGAVVRYGVLGPEFSLTLIPRFEVGLGLNWVW